MVENQKIEIITPHYWSELETNLQVANLPHVKKLTGFDSAYSVEVDPLHRDEVVEALKKLGVTCFDR